MAIQASLNGYSGVTAASGPRRDVRGGSERGVPTSEPSVLCEMQVSEFSQVRRTASSYLLLLSLMSSTERRLSHHAATT